MTSVCLTFDVEERFHSHLSVPGVAREFRSGEILRELLDWLTEHDRPATFFVVGELAENDPEVVRRMVERGHEVGSHSQTHLRLDGPDTAAILDDIGRSKDVLEQITGAPVEGFRAPSWSARRDDRRLWDGMVRLGFTYDSSLFPFWTPMYGSLSNPNRPYRVHPGLLEIPPSALGPSPLRVPFGGGFYFRLTPLALTRALVRLGARTGVEPVLYFHPWELRSTGESIDDGPFKAFIANHGVDRAWDRFVELAGGFRTRTMASLRDELSGQVAEDEVAQAAGSGQRHA